MDNDEVDIKNDNQVSKKKQNKQTNKSMGL